jgi:hypothetical protein
LSVEKSVTLADVEYQEAKIVAEYQHRSFSAYARHCIAIETNRRIKEAEAARDKKMAHVDGKPQ